MNATRFPFVSALLVTLLTTAALPALATTATFNGNGQTGFVGAVSSGTLTVADDGNGGIDFTFALGNGQVNLGGNDLVIYLDNSKGGGIGTSTSGLNDSGDGAREAVSEYTATGDGGGVGQSILNFGGLMNPQYAVDLSITGGGNNQGNSDIFQLSNSPGNFGLPFVDNAAASGTSANGETYTVANGVMSVDIPAVDFGLSSFSGSTLKFAAIEVSESGYSASEGTVGLSGAEGWGNTQTMTSVNSFAVASVPEASSVGLLVCGAGVLLLRKRK